jgi:hypothetical protein
LARLALALMVAFLIIGFLWYRRIWTQLIERPTEKMKFRFCFSP